MIESVVKGLNLDDYKAKIESDDEVPHVALPCQTKFRNKHEVEAKKDTPTVESKNFGRNENEYSQQQSVSKNSNLTKIDYPSEKDALSQSLDVR
mgnify:CR=1 FL=1